MTATCRSDRPLSFRARAGASFDYERPSGMLGVAAGCGRENPDALL